MRVTTCALEQWLKVLNLSHHSTCTGIQGAAMEITDLLKSALYGMLCSACIHFGQVFENTG